MKWKVTGGTKAMTPNGVTTAGPGSIPTTHFIVTEEIGTFQLKFTYEDANGIHRITSPEVSVPESLQELELTIEELLGLPPSALLLSVENPDDDGKKDLVFRLAHGICTPGFDPDPGPANPCEGAFRLDKALSQNLNINLGRGLGAFVSIENGGQVSLDFSATAQLNFGVALDPDSFNPENPQAATFVLNSSGLSAVASLDASNIQLSTAAGPIKLQAGTAEDPGVAKLGVRFSLMDADVNSSDEKKVPVSAINDVGFSGTDPNVSCGEVDLDGDGPATPEALAGNACMRLPLFLDSTSLGVLGFAVPNGQLRNSSAWKIAVPGKLRAELDKLLHFDLLFDGLELVLIELVEKGLDGKSYSVRIPLVGEDLSAGAVSDIAKDFRKGLLRPLEDLDFLIGRLPANDIETCIETLLKDALGPPGTPAATCPGAPVENQDGLDLLQGEVNVSLICASTVCDPSADTTKIDEAKVELAIGKGNIGAPDTGCDPAAGNGCLSPAEELDFDIEFPGLRLSSATGQVAAGVGWRLNLAFGISRAAGTDGFFLEPPKEGELLTVGAAVTLPRSMKGELAFLETDIKDNNSSKAAFLFTLNTGAPGGRRITFSSLSSGVDLSQLDFRIKGQANIDLHLKTGVRGQHGFPSVDTDFVLTWGIEAGRGSPLSTDDLSIAFNNISINPGSLLNDFMLPITQEVRNVTMPFKPVVDTLKTPVPVLSRLSEEAGGERITLLDLLEITEFHESREMIDNLDAFLKFADDLPNAQVEQVGIPMGSFKPDAARLLQGSVTPDQIGTLIVEQTPPSSNPVDTAKGSGINLAETGGLSFPFLEDPSQAYGLLLGQDIVLARYDAGTMRGMTGISQTYSVPVGPIFMDFTIAGSAALEGRFAMGYDTLGLRQAVQGGSGDPLLNGIFIEDFDVNAVDVPEMTLSGDIKGSVSISAVLVKAGIEGGIRMTFLMNLRNSPDPDGKLRFAQIAGRLNRPVCLFDHSGRLSAFLSGFAEVGFRINLPWPLRDIVAIKRFTKNIASTTLLDFSRACSSAEAFALDTPPPSVPFFLLTAPHLAEQQGDELVLNMGSQERRSARGVAADAIDETFLVRQIGPGKFSVTAFGLYQEFPEDNSNIPISTIRADAEDGNDSISLLAGIDMNGEIVPFSAKAIINGGPGNDHIMSGDSDDQLSGGFGNDKVYGGEGSDFINGDNDDDVIEGWTGDDAIYGGPGNDVLVGGAGSDKLDGGKGGDDIFGGPGTKVHPDGNNTITADPSDQVEGNVP
jgi:hypothetical protein